MTKACQKAFGYHGKGCGVSLGGGGVLLPLEKGFPRTKIFSEKLCLRKRTENAWAGGCLAGQPVISTRSSLGA